MRGQGWRQVLEGNLEAVVRGWGKNCILTNKYYLYNPHGNAHLSLPKVFRPGPLPSNDPTAPTAAVEMEYLILYTKDCESPPLRRESISSSTTMVTHGIGNRNGNRKGTGASMAIEMIIVKNKKVQQSLTWSSSCRTGISGKTVKLRYICDPPEVALK